MRVKKIPTKFTRKINKQIFRIRENLIYLLDKHSIHEVNQEEYYRVKFKDEIEIFENLSRRRENIGKFLKSYPKRNSMRNKSID